MTKRKVVDGANRPKKMLVKGTLDAIIIQRLSHKVIQKHLACARITFRAAGLFG